jgi:polyisoprenoid-binding protein YceI
MLSPTRTVPLLIATFARLAVAQSESWTIDPSHTTARFSVRQMVVSRMKGRFDKLCGTIRMAGTDLRTLGVDVTIDVASLNTGVEKRDDDLRSAKFFDAASYPTITFVSKRAEPVSGSRLNLVGDLTIHGVTREVVLDVRQLELSNSVRATATTKINRRDFGLEYSRIVEGSAVEGDSIHSTIDLRALPNAER